MDRKMDRSTEAVGKGRFWREQGGSTAVEFALILLPLVALTLACIETSR